MAQNLKNVYISTANVDYTTSVENARGIGVEKHRETGM
jgi:hypothetical protein